MEVVSEGNRSMSRSLDLINCVFVGGCLDQCVCVCVCVRQGDIHIVPSS